jgi:hypothetical protein
MGPDSVARSSSTSGSTSGSSSGSSSGTSSLSHPEEDVVSLSHPLPGLLASLTPAADAGSSNSGSGGLPPLSYCLLLNASLCSTTVQYSRGPAAAAVAAAAGAAGAGPGAGDTPGDTVASAASNAADNAGGSNGFLVVVYNPLAWPRREGVRLPVDDQQTYTVTGEGLAIK